MVSVVYHGKLSSFGYPKGPNSKDQCAAGVRGQEPFLGEMPLQRRFGLNLTGLTTAPPPIPKNDVGPF
eukprot:CAMPEP_0171967040 /NCGR_PEP_ID=MMETSP0993-20121228/195632_1 /TAXON_ID=483369 /ORGANISM="non described non described, Strain CCMP2098" /LENGTH=67 /DNA_ID=CAMNT_0012616455 /DNA_START=178 /DNA_END=381 /DNA_ORIENTATION=+